MKKDTKFYLMPMLALAVALSVAGCYTQLGTIRENDEDSDMDQPYERDYYGVPVDSTTRVINNYYFGGSYGGFYPSARYRFGFSFYYPSYYWGWYDPFWYDPFYSNWYNPFWYDPWICGTPFIGYGYPWYYRSYGFGYPYYGWSPYYYPRIYNTGGDVFHGTRNFGSTRGTAGGLRGSGTSRGADYIPPPMIPSRTPTVTGSSGRRSEPSTINPNAGRDRTGGRRSTEVAPGRGSRGDDRQGGGRSSGRDSGSRRGDSEKVRRYSIFPPRYIPPVDAPRQSGSGKEGSDRSRDDGRREQSGGRDSYNPPSPQSAPSYSPPPSPRSSGGGDRGGSSGGRSSGSGGRSGGSTGGRR